MHIPLGANDSDQNDLPDNKRIRVDMAYVQEINYAFACACF